METVAIISNVFNAQLCFISYKSHNSVLCYAGVCVKCWLFCIL